MEFFCHLQVVYVFFSGQKFARKFFNRKQDLVDVVLTALVDFLPMARALCTFFFSVVFAVHDFFCWKLPNPDPFIF